MSAELIIKHIMRFIFYIGFFLISIEATEHIDMELIEEPLPEELTLVYDVYDNQNLYCRFGTIEEIQKSPGLVSKACFEKYTNLTHTKPNGTAAFPYLIFQMTIGYTLKCESDLPNGRLESCDARPYVGTKCKPICSDGYVALGDSVTCRLMKPVNNTTAKWWPPCLSQQLRCEAEIQNGKLLSCDTEHHFVGTKCRYSCINGYQANSTELICQKQKSMISAEWSPVDPCQIIEPLKVQVPHPTPFSWQIMTVAAVVILIVVLVLAVGLFLYKKKQADQVHRYRPNETTTEVGIPELPNDKIFDSFVSEPMLNKQLEFKNYEVNKIESTDSLVEVHELRNNQDGNLDLSTSLVSLSSKQIEFESDEDNTMTTSAQQVQENKQGNNPKDRCHKNVNFLYNGQDSLYRAKLRGELEIIEGRPVSQTLAGFVRTNWKDLRFASENDVKVHEETYRQRTDEKVSDSFLQIMSQHDYKIGNLLDYFQAVGSRNVISVILEVHTDCPYCDQFRIHVRKK